MKLRILGCGTSTGVPNVRTGWGKCDPAEPRNRRSRSSVMLESGGKRLLVDCGPDLREQLLSADIVSIDAVIVTHDHADHCHGIDDLRPVAQQLGAPIPIHARADVVQRLRSRFEYAFVQAGFYPPVAELSELGADLAFNDAVLRFIDQPHGNITSLGMRIDEGSRSIGYAIDFHELTGGMARLYEGVDVWVCDCLMEQPHPTHAHLDAVLDWAKQLNVGQLYLTHMGNGMDYQALRAKLPDWAAPAHDGLEVELA